MPAALLILFVVALGAAALSPVGRRATRPIGPIGRDEEDRLAMLTPDTRRFAVHLRERLRATGIETFLGETWRSPERQRELYEEGRRTAVLEPGWHSFGRAFHLYILDPMTGKLDTKARRQDLYESMHAIARKMGGHVYGYRELRTRSGKSFRDPHHVEYRAGYTLAELRRKTGYA
ncbi:MAG: hypothetical protein ACRD1Z_09365 [Vicinamibacteria bacterium]